MTNVEYYKDEILKLGGDFSIDKNTGDLCNCSALSCDRCRFNIGVGEQCEAVRVRWMCEDYRDVEEIKQLVRSHIITKLNCDGVTCKECTMYALANRDKINKPKMVYDCQWSCLKTVDLIVRKGIGVLLEEADYAKREV